MLVVKEGVAVRRRGGIDNPAELVRMVGSLGTGGDGRRRRGCRDAVPGRRG